MARLVRRVPSNQEGPGSSPVSSIMSFSKTFYLHCCSPPRCINGYPVGMEWVRQCGCHANLEWFLLGMDRCLIDLQASNDRGNNIVKRLEMIINHIRCYINQNTIIIISQFTCKIFSLIATSLALNGILFLHICRDSGKAGKKRILKISLPSCRPIISITYFSKIMYRFGKVCIFPSVIIIIIIITGFYIALFQIMIKALFQIMIKALHSVLLPRS